MNEREDGDWEKREREQWIVYNYLFSAIWNAINKQIGNIIYGRIFSKFYLKRIVDNV